jgi:hypothetical protein
VHSLLLDAVGVAPLLRNVRCRSSNGEVSYRQGLCPQSKLVQKEEWFITPVCPLEAARCSGVEDDASRIEIFTHIAGEV